MGSVPLSVDFDREPESVVVFGAIVSIFSDFGQQQVAL
jgi:hypothetical protein